MDYFKAWISLIGWDELAFIAAVFLLMFAFDRLMTWYEKRPWTGLSGRFGR